jgi:hypothetical protein
MRRPMLLATLLLFTFPAVAQMRGGRAGMGGHPGSPAHSSFGGARGGHFGRPTWSGAGFGGRFGGRFGNGFHHHHRFFPRTWAFGYWGYPAYAYAWPPDYSFDIGDYSAPDRGGYGSASYNQQAAIEQRLDRIEDRLDRLIDRLQSPPQPAAAPQATRPASADASSTATLVFRDGHTEQVDNYAVVGRTLWLFSEQRARKVPLAEINIEATEQTNQQRGIDLHLPKA